MAAGCFAEESSSPSGAVGLYSLTQTQCLLPSKPCAIILSLILLMTPNRSLHLRSSGSFCVPEECLTLHWHREMFSSFLSLLRDHSSRPFSQPRQRNSSLSSALRVWSSHEALRVDSHGHFQLFFFSCELMIFQNFLLHIFCFKHPHVD